VGDGGIGGHAASTLNGGGAIGVSSPERAVPHDLGVEAVTTAGRRLPLLADENGGRERVAPLARTSAPSSATTPTSSSSTRAANWRGVDLQKAGGTVVTCAATSGYMVEFDTATG
jgi:crotonyl-CoA reductase